MKLPFSTGQFMDIFRQYNTAVWPAQLLLNILAAIMIILCLKPAKVTTRFVFIALAALWLWMGIAYHLLFFAAINPAARIFGALFILQGVLFLYAAIRQSFRFAASKGIDGIAGGTLVLYSLIIYPAAGYLTGHVYPASPTFGLPCPTVIFTLGILLWTQSRVPWLFVVIPLLWSLIGFSAAFTMGVTEDYGLLVAGIVFFTLSLRRKQQMNDDHSSR